MPQHVDFAVGELHNAHDAEDEGQTKGHEDIDPSQGKPVDQTLPEFLCGNIQTQAPNNTQLCLALFPPHNFRVGS